VAVLGEGEGEDEGMLVSEFTLLEGHEEVFLGDGGVVADDKIEEGCIADAFGSQEFFHQMVDASLPPELIKQLQEHTIDGVVLQDQLRVDRHSFLLPNHCLQHLYRRLVAEIALLQRLEHRLHLASCGGWLAEEDLQEEIGRVFGGRAFGDVPVEHSHDFTLVSCVLEELQVDLAYVELLQDEIVEAEGRSDAITTLSAQGYLLVLRTQLHLAEVGLVPQQFFEGGKRGQRGAVAVHQVLQEEEGGVVEATRDGVEDDVAGPAADRYYDLLVWVRAKVPSSSWKLRSLLRTARRVWWIRALAEAEVG
jgi:hypothetical protein